MIQIRVQSIFIIAWSGYIVTIQFNASNFKHVCANIHFQWNVVSTICVADKENTKKSWCHEHPVKCGSQQLANKREGKRFAKITCAQRGVSSAVWLLSIFRPAIWASGVKGGRLVGGARAGGNERARVVQGAVFTPRTTARWLSTPRRAGWQTAGVWVEIIWVSVCTFSPAPRG